MMDARRSMRAHDARESLPLQTPRRCGDLPFLQWTHMHQVRGHPARLLPRCARSWRIRARRRTMDPALRPRTLIPGSRFPILLPAALHPPFALRQITLDRQE